MKYLRLFLGTLKTGIDLKAQIWGHDVRVKFLYRCQSWANQGYGVNTSLPRVLKCYLIEAFILGFPTCKMTIMLSFSYFLLLSVKTTIITFLSCLIQCSLSLRWILQKFYQLIAIICGCTLGFLFCSFITLICELCYIYCYFYAEDNKKQQVEKPRLTMYLQCFIRLRIVSKTVFLVLQFSPTCILTVGFLLLLHDRATSKVLDVY